MTEKGEKRRKNHIVHGIYNSPNPCGLDEGELPHCLLFRTSTSAKLVAQGRQTKMNVGYNTGRPKN